MKNRLLTWVTALAVAIVMVMGGSSAVFADTGETTGSLQWCNYVGDYNAKEVQTPPAYHNGYVYFVTQHSGSSYLQRIKEDVSVGEDKKVQNGQIETLAELNGKLIEYATIAPTIDADAGKIYIPLTGCFVIVPIEGGTPVYVDTDGVYTSGGQQTISPITYDNEYIYAGTWGGSSPNNYYRIAKSNPSNKTVMTEDSSGFYWAGACPVTLTDGSGVIFGSDSKNVYLYSNKTNSVIDTLGVSGKVRSSVVSDGNGNYYFSAYGSSYGSYSLGYLYKVSIQDNKLVVADNYPVDLSGGSTCTPVISGSSIYVGTDKKTIDIFDSNGVKTSSEAPGTVKSLTEINGTVYAPDNALSGNKGGIIKADGSQFFMPDESMQQSNIYQIATNDDGTMLFFKNDSGYLMAVSTGAKPDGGEEDKDPVLPDETDKGEAADVYVTVTNKGVVKLAQEKVKVKDIDKDGKLTVNDALYIAHENYYEGGAAAGYRSETGEYGLSLCKLWGDESGCFGYRVNNKAAWSLADAVEDGDYVNAYIYKDQQGWSDLYTWFDKNFLSVKTGELFTLTLYAAGYDGQWNEVVEPVSNADITIDGVPTVYRTNELGQVTFSIPEKGEYVISAESKIKTLVPPVCKVSVSDKASAAAQNDKTGGDKSTETGDDFNMTAVIVIALAALAAAVVIITVRKRRS